MPYNFLSLVNSVNGRLNEVPLTEQNFFGATGFYSQAKDAVNAALRDIYQDAFEWPFTHTTAQLVLTPDQGRYPYPADAKAVAFDSFRIKGEAAFNNQTQRLAILDYEEFLEKCADSDFNPEKYSATPSQVFRTPDMGFGVYPPPKVAYTLAYEYYRLPIDLEAWDDVPLLPEQFKHIIVDGATHYSYMFRGDPESAAVMLQKQQQGIKNTRKIYQNRFEYMRSGFIQPVTRGNVG